MASQKPRVTLALTGPDGNVFVIIARVRRALRVAGTPDLADEFVRRTMKAKSYDEVLLICLEYVDIG